MNFENEINKIRSEISYYVPDEFDQKIKPGTEVWLYGAGFLGCKYADLLKDAGFHVMGLFETNIRQEEERHSYQVKKVVYQGAPVVISSFKYYEQMQAALESLGYPQTQIVSPFAVFEKFYIPRFERAFSLFDDALSKKLVIDKIRYHVFEPKMEPVSAYFDTEMFSQSENEVLVDGGAFDGQTAIEFAQVFNGKYAHIYCFEPTRSSYEQAVENLRGYARVDVINKGLYSSDTVLQFKDFGADQWNSTNDYFMGHEWNGPAMDYTITEVPVTSLDLFFREKPESEYPTIIKLDIEGSEREALLGMRHVLNTSHPKLIICAYHKPEDYYELAETIHELCPGYRLKLRHYTDNILESIIFAQYQCGDFDRSVGGNYGAE